MSEFETIAERLEADAERAAALPVLLGFDGTIDRLYSVVRERSGLGEDFTAFPRIGDFGGKINTLAGRSGIMELWPRREKIGGNGPICALALAASSRRMRYIGPLGDPVDPAFGALVDAAEAVVSIGEPAVTHALEFNDGKIMLPVLRSYEALTPEHLIERVGRERLAEWVGGSRLVCLLNWTCLPHMDGIYRSFTEAILPAAAPDPERLYFFDLADPSKHARARIRGAVERIAAFAPFGRTALGLNFSEAVQLCEVFGLPEPACEDAALEAAATALREAAGVDVLMIHPVDRAACATSEGAWCVRGPLCTEPVITTGAGDHLNAGFCLGLLLGWPPEDCLRLGVLFSGYYVRTAQSPSLRNIQHFASNPGMPTPEILH